MSESHTLYQLSRTIWLRKIMEKLETGQMMEIHIEIRFNNKF